MAVRSSLKIFLLSNIIIWCVIWKVYGDCNVCNSLNNLACVSTTQFQVCINDYPSGPLNSCPTGYICSTTSAQICVPPGSAVVAACDDCNKCDVTNTFACTGARTYALCLGTTAPTDLTGTCAPDHVCNINIPQICGNTTEGVPPTCSYYDDGIPTQTPWTTTHTTSTTAPTSTPTTAANINPQQFCRSVRQNGRFPAGYDINSTCKQYIYCFVNGGIWYGQLYNCPGSTYFDNYSRLCNSTAPPNCYDQGWIG